MTATFTKTVRKASLALAIAASFSALSSTAELCLQRRGAAAVHRRRFPPVQLRNPEHPEDHRLHVQASRRTLHAAAAP